MSDAILSQEGTLSVRIDFQADRISFDELRLVESHLGDLILGILSQAKEED